MKIVFKLIENIIIVILLILVIINGLFAYSKYIKKDKIANVFGYTYMVVQSNSMIPEFKYGDKLIVLLNEEYEVGDIITFEEDGFFITHRIVRITGDVIVTKGDSNNAEDTPITRDKVIGVVKKILK